MLKTYRTFKRSARNFDEFARARKITVDRRLSYSEARRACQEFNADLTPAQECRGLKMEFEAE